MKMNLEDFSPEPGSFHLKAMNKTYTLNPVSLGDEAWLKAQFGKEIEKVLSEIQMEAIARIVFHQLPAEEKQDFKMREVTVINEEGFETQEQMGGVNLLKHVIVGIEEKLAVFNALLKTIGMSRLAEENIKLPTGEKKSPEVKTSPKKRLTRKA